MLTLEGQSSIDFVIKASMKRKLSTEKELQLEPLNTLCPELNYEYSISSLYSAPKSPQTLGGGHYRKPLAPPSGGAKLRRGWNPALLFPESVYKSGTWHYSGLTKEDAHQIWNFDYLDLHRMAERFYDRRVWNNANVNVYISAHDRERYRQNLAVAAFNDRILKEAYAKLAGEKVPEIEKRRVRCLIRKFETMPHLYRPQRREQSIGQHVGNWLIKHTDKPEADKVGFTSRDPFEPRMFIATTEPRLSSSETNVVLGKRKRVEMEEDECEVGAMDSGSDTLLVTRNDCVRPLGAKRRRIARRRR